MPKITELFKALAGPSLAGAQKTGLRDKLDVPAASRTSTSIMVFAVSVLTLGGILPQIFPIFDSCKTLVIIKPPSQEFEVVDFQNIGLTFYDSLESMKVAVPEGCDSLDTDIGFLFLGDLSSHAILDKMSTVNPQARMVILSSDESVTIRAWTAYKMINVMTLSNGSLCTFNPFLDVLRCGSVSEVKDFLDQKLLNLNGYPMEVSVFEDSGVCKRQGDRYIYKDGEVGYLLSKVMNFRPNYYTNPDKQKFGFEISENGTTKFTGALDDVFTGRCEFSTNVRIITDDYHADSFTYLYPVSPLTLSWVVPVEFYKVTFDVFPDRFFDRTTRSLKIFCTLFVTVVYFAIELLESRFSRDQPRMPIMKILLNLNSLLCNVTLAKFPARFRSRFLLLVFMTMTFIINNSYQSLILSALNKGSSAGDIQRIDQLLDSGLQMWVERGLSVFTKPMSQFPPGSKYHRMYTQTMSTQESSFDEPVKCVQNRTCAFLSPDNLVQYFRMLTYQGSVTIHNVPETPFWFYEAHIINKSSPFLSRINTLIGQIVDSGFIDYGNKKATFDYQVQYIQFVLHAESNGGDHLKLLRLKHFKNVFIYYLAANGVAFGVLLIEIVFSRVTRNSRFGSSFVTRVLCR